VKKRGLGKTLDALLGGALLVQEGLEQNNVNHREEKLRQLSVGLIQSGQYQPRRGISSERLEELANSIRAQGVIQPIIVRYLPNGRYEIVAGERRWRAAQLAGLSDIPAIVREIPDEAAMAIALIENIQRENLNPIEEALALQRLSEEFSMTHHQLAEAVGKSRATVTNLLRLLTLTDEVKRMLEQGDLEMGHARALLVLGAELQLETARAIVAKQLSVREAENWVRRLQMTPASIETPRSPDPDVERLQASLSGRLRLPVIIQHHQKGHGKVLIKYGSIAELDALLSYLH
jgi:ParB family chromosome partitioning protein